MNHLEERVSILRKIVHDTHANDKTKQDARTELVRIFKAIGSDQ
jgi:hypothetical protein